MTGVALLIFTPDTEEKKEYMIHKLAEALQKHDIETHVVNLMLPDAFEKLQKVNSYFCSIPFSKKHFLFSFDGDGFEIETRLDGRFVDYMKYNVFSYFTKHPKYYKKLITGINSWYISILSCTEDGVSFVEKHFPHLDGTEAMVFPCFCCEDSEPLIQKRKNDLLFLADATPKSGKILESLNSAGLNPLIYGTGWTDAGSGQINLLPEKEMKFSMKLNLMGNSKITVFSHDEEYFGADTDVLSAAANGTVVFTDSSEELKTVFSEKELLFYDPENLQILCNQIKELLQKPEQMQKLANMGKKKAEQSGDISCFIEKLLQRCK